MSSITFALCILIGSITGSLVAENFITLWLALLLELPVGYGLTEANPFFKRMLAE
jgi:hypothetical protein